MLREAFTSRSPYKKRARTLTILWALLIFILCFIPGQEFPDVNIPMADKWVHFVLFAVFTFLWMCAQPTVKLLPVVITLLVGITFGWLVEELQGLLSFLGRSKSIKDIYADAIGAALGVLLFLFGAMMSRPQSS
jgi:VanZ family protein